MLSFTTLSALTLLLSKQILQTKADFCDGDDPLACYNEGLCVNGSKNFEALLGITDAGMVSRSIRGMYCDCPDDIATAQEGYTGVHCGTPFERCGDGSVCFNGGFCERDSRNVNKYHCGCPMDELNQVWAGLTCENKPTSYCSEDAFYDLAGSRWFCTNDGICVDGETDLSKKCQCPDGFTGVHCEFEVKDTAPSDYCDALDPVTQLAGEPWSCKNNGTCLNGVTDVSKKCECPVGFSGPRCEVDESLICNLECYNGGTCKKGAKDLSAFIDFGLDIDYFLGGSNEEGEHCVCTEGFFGLNCELEEEKDEINYCGDGVCFNGGLCVEKQGLNGETLDYHCECNGFEKESVAGEFCEHTDVTWCPAPEGHDATKYYCANGGNCPSLENSHLGCTACDEGWTGTRCETVVENYEEVVERNECDLDCKNGGECFFGDHPIEDPVLTSIKGLEFLSDNKHCRCPSGYIGLRCEMRYERCGAGQHYCLHGSGCVEDNDEFTCDCNEVSTSFVAYAGHYCEHTATEFCQGPGAGKHSFCTNHGKCRGQVGFGDDHVGCDCDDGWTGEYCEYEISQLRTNGIATTIFVGFIVGLIMFLITLSIICFVRRRSKGTAAYHTAPVHELHSNPYGDENASDDEDDDYELKEVTII